MFVKNAGFFRDYLKWAGVDTGNIVVPERVRGPQDLAGHPFWSLTELLARVPELRNTWDDVMKRPPSYVGLELGGGADGWTVYVPQHHRSRHFRNDTDAYAVLGPMPAQDKEARQLEKGRQWAHATDDPNAPFPLPRHTTAWCSTAYISPLCEGLDKPLHYHFMALYVLSILVRYRPNRWREILEGDLQRFRQLLSEYVMIAERIVPNLFLDHLVLRRHIFAGHSYLG